MYRPILQLLTFLLLPAALYAAPAVTFDYRPPAALAPVAALPGTPCAAPVSDGAYLAVTTATELRVYRARQLTPEGKALDYPYGLLDESGRLVTPALLPELPLVKGDARFATRAAEAGPVELCLILPAKRWISAPVFGRLAQPTAAGDLTRTVLYALEDLGDGGCRACCMALDPLIAHPADAGRGLAHPPEQVSLRVWNGPRLPSLARAALTLSGGRLLITVLGDPAPGAPWRVYLLDARTGECCARVAPTSACRLTAAARVLPADSTTPERLLLTGEQDGAAALWLAPPRITARLTPPHPPLSRIPADLILADSRGRRYPIGDPKDPFRGKHIAAIAAHGATLTVTFRDWNLFLPHGTEPPLLAPPLTLSYAPVLPTAVRLYPLRNPPLTGLEPEFPSPILLPGAAPAHAAALVAGEAVITGVTCSANVETPLLAVNGQPATVRLHTGALLRCPLPEAQPDWQFPGDTRGPRSQAIAGQWWESDFPYPSAAGDGTLYAVATYRGVAGSGPLPVAAPARAVLYALDPATPSNLRQVVAAGTVTGWPDEDPYLLQVHSAWTGFPLQIGARVLLQVSGDAPFTCDLGHILAISPPPGDPAASYRVTVERPRPPEAQLAAARAVTLLAAIATPYVSHVQAWNSVTGAEPLRDYQRTGSPATRANEGLCHQAPTGNPANADPREGLQEVMIALTGLETTCHAPGVPDPATHTLRLEDADFLPAGSAALAAWRAAPHVYLPRIAAGRFNYLVDHRAGRITLTPPAAGALADRFVVVHYFTTDTLDGKATAVRHAEIMYVPTPVRWQYTFPDALPASAPLLVGDRLYLTMLRQAAGQWQPALYTFAAAPQDPRQARPLAIQPIGQPVERPDAAVFAPVPALNGLAVGVPGALALLGAQDVLVADGQRLLRLNSAGQLAWQAVGMQGKETLRFTLLTAVRRLANGNLLLCDTGANRVAEMDRQGQFVWQYPDGAPEALGLLEPRDARRYVRENPVEAVYTGEDKLGPATVRWENTLIADAGHQRLLEIHRPLVRLDAGEFQYRPELHYLAAGKPVPLQQTVEVVADGARLQWDGAPTPALTFTLALRYPDAEAPADDPVMAGVRGLEYLAAVAGQAADPAQPRQPLRTVHLRQDVLLPHPMQPTANALAIRPGRGDYAQVRQLDLIALRDGNRTEARVLVVDDVGVREVPLAPERQGAPVFEMTASGYARALAAPGWGEAVGPRAPDLLQEERQAWQARLDAWRKDSTFHPVAVLRLDAGEGLADADPRTVRYRILLLQTLASPDPATWLDGKACRRTQLVDVCWTDPALPYAGHTQDGWGLLDTRGHYAVTPDPLASDFPAIPGTYPLTTPLGLCGGE